MLERWPKWDSNPQSSAPKADALSIRPLGLVHWWTQRHWHTVINKLKAISWHCQFYANSYVYNEDIVLEFLSCTASLNATLERWPRWDSNPESLTDSQKQTKLKAISWNCQFSANSWGYSVILKLSSWNFLHSPLKWKPWKTTQVGLEPTIHSSWGWCLIH